MELLNAPRHAVSEMLEGLVSSVDHLNRLDGFPEVPVTAREACWTHKIIVRALDCMQDEVWIDAAA